MNVDDLLEVMEVDDNDDFEFIFNSVDERAPKHRYKRINWNEHVAVCDRKPSGFQKRYHMNEEAFNNLVEILEITVQEGHSRACTNGNQPILPQIVVGCGLRYLGGEHCKSLVDVFGMSETSVQTCIDKFIKAVLNCNELDLKLPATREELQQSANEFLVKSDAGDIFDGCVGCIDGWLCCIQLPRDATNQADFFSGHYKRYGLNVQAVCDAKLRFIYIGIIGAGRTNDSKAFSRCTKLREWLSAIPDDFYLIGDNAYPLSNSVLIPFRQAPLQMIGGEIKRTYNFYLSQLRINIELAFGQLTNKWRIFRNDLQTNLPRTKDIVMCCARLHNYVINVDGDTLFEDDASDTYVPTMNEADENSLEAWHGIPEPYNRRLEILDAIEANGIVRPVNNIERNG